MLVDNKDKTVVAESDIDKLVRDAKERSTSRRGHRSLGRRASFGRLTRRPAGDRRTGSGYSERHASGFPAISTCSSLCSNGCGRRAPISWKRMPPLREEVRRTFADLDRIERELKKAAKAIGSASGLVGKYRGRLQELCDSCFRTRARHRRSAASFTCKDSQDGGQRKTSGGRMEPRVGIFWLVEWRAVISEQHVAQRRR